MTPERWRQIEDLYNLACDRGDGVLADADPELRREVQEMLAQKSDGKVLDQAAFDLMMDSTQTQAMAGSRLGPYRIEAPLGRGGMGQVFRAIDTRLGREVAIKVSQERFSDRFEREARAIAALNHPNICTLHDVGPNYLVMELVEGETLAARLKRGKLSLDQTIQYGAQIASGLSAAHAKGIVHRDLKPGNVIITKTGVKVLDFGLAKSALDETLTMADAIMGTPAYMAPEQRDGRPCDERSDIYALGLVLFEMATGKRVPPEGPQLDSLPERLAHVVERCLALEPDNRWQSARDVKSELEWAAQADVGHAELPRRTSLLWPTVAAASILALAAVSFIHFREIPEAAVRAMIAMPEGTTVLQGFSISPDGRYLVVAPEVHGKLQLWLRPMDQDRLQPMPGTEDAQQPFWSPDSREIAYFADGKLRKIDINGGPSQSLCNATNPHGGSWSSDGVIVFSPDTAGISIQRVAASGGTPADVTKTEGDLEYPVFLPGGRRFFYVARGGTDENSGVFVSSLDGTENRRILPDVSPVVFSPPPQHDRIGHILFIRENTLMAAPFDAASARIAGDAVPVAEGATSPAVSDNGVLVYSTSTGLADATNQLGWYDRSGKLLSSVTAPSAVVEPAISHDEKSVAFRRLTNGKSDLWVHDLNSGRETRITENASSAAPFWSPQDDRIVFESNQTGASKLYQRLSNGSGRDELLLQGKVSPWPTQWSRDGRYIVYFEVNRSKNKRDIWVLPTEGANLKPIPFLTTEADEFLGQLSPDDHWMAFTSDRSGRNEVYVRPFPPGEGEWTISLAGGRAPRWRGDDGKELYFIAADGNLTAIQVKRAVPGPKPSFEAGAPVELFDAHLAHAGLDTLFEYDVTADGKRFLIDTALVAARAQLTVVTNWAADLRK